jgi:hypothetical protein
MPADHESHRPAPCIVFPYDAVHMDFMLEAA